MQSTLQDTESDLISSSQAGDLCAQTALLEKFRPMLWKLTRKYTPQGEDMEDFFQIASMAFIEAVGRYDASKGAKLITFSYKWVWGKLKTAQKEVGTIRVPHYVDRKSEAFLNVQRPISLDENFVNSEFSMGSALADDKPSFLIDLEDYEELNRLRDAIKQLPERLSRVVQGRLEGMSLNELGEELGISKERVRQLETLAYKELKILMADVPALSLPKTRGLFWTQDELRFLKHNHSKKTVLEISRIMKRPYTSTVAKATSLGLCKKPFWTDRDDNFLLANREHGWKECARLMGRGIQGIYNRARRLGIVHKRLTADDGKVMRQMHSQGKSTTEIGDVLGVSAECIRVNLNKAKLSVGNRDETKRLRNLRDSLMKNWGVEAVSQVREIKMRRRAMQYGWGDIPLRAVVILESLARIGRPADRNEIAAERSKVIEEMQVGGSIRKFKEGHSWVAVLQSTKWLIDHKFLTMEGNSNRLKSFWFTEGFAISIADKSVV